MPFKFSKLENTDLELIEPQVYFDDRGYFLESYKESDFSQNGIELKFCQDNNSLYKKNGMRGLHYQLRPK